jgi:putative peptidoglycan lipid II flippase
MSLFRAASLIAGITILSKLLGALRDWQVMTVYGASLLSDAYYAAFQLPSFALILLGGISGPFHTAIITVLSPWVQADRRPSQFVKRYLGWIFLWSGVLFTLLAILTTCYARNLLSVMLPGSSPELLTAAAQQMQWMAPIMVLGPWAGVLYGILNLHKRFFWPSFSPAALSMVMVIALALFPDDTTGWVLAGATVAGTVMQLAVQLPDCIKLGYFSSAPMDATAPASVKPALAATGKMIFPALMGTMVGQLNVYVDMFFTSSLPVGGWSAVILANRLLQLPVGVMQSALLVPVYPMFAQFVATNNLDGIRQTYRKGITSLWLLCMPILVAVVCFGLPLIQLLFQHGRFDAQASVLVYQSLMGLSFSMVFYFARDTTSRVYFAFQDTRTPLYVGIASIVINALMDALLVGPLGVAGITLSTSIVAFVNLVALLVLLKQHLPGLGIPQLAYDFTRLLLAGVSLLVLALGAYQLPVDPLMQAGIWAVVSLPIYFALCCLLKVPSALSLLNRLPAASALLKR